MWNDGSEWQASAACVVSKVTAASQLCSTSGASTPGGASRVTVSGFNGVVHQYVRSASSQQSSSIYGEASVVLRSCARKQGLWKRGSGSRNAVVAMSAGAEAEIPSLNDLPLINYINQQGRIQPPVEVGTAASVFVVCDENKKIQVWPLMPCAYTFDNCMDSVLFQ